MRSLSPRFPIAVSAALAVALFFSAGCSAPAPAAPDAAVAPDAAAPDAATAAPDAAAAPDATAAGDAGAPPADAAGTPDTGPAAPTCVPRAAVAPVADFFLDFSEASGIRVGNFDPAPPVTVPINDHSRLAIADLNGDGFDDLVAHSLYPNPQAGIPFEHLVFLNNGDGTFRDFSDASGLRAVQSAFFVFGDVDNDGDQDLFSGVDVPLTGATNQIFLNDGAAHFAPVAVSGVSTGSTVAGNAVFADFDGDARLDLYVGNGHTSYSAPDRYFLGHGDGTFTEASQNLLNNPSQPTNGTVTCDFDDDGDLDIVVSTYGVSAGLGLNILWRNDGGVFTNVAVAQGFASLPGGNFWLGLGDTPEPGKGPGTYMGSNGFGVDCQDVTGDGLMDIYLTAISHPVASDYSRKWSDPTQLLVNQGPGAGYAFVNEGPARGVPFNEGDVDGSAVDFDNDGRLDLATSRDKKYEGSYDTVDQKAWFGLLRQRTDGAFEGLGPVSGINSLDAVLDASLTTCTVDSECAAVPGEACLATRCRWPCASDGDCKGPQENCHTDGFCKLLLTMKSAQNHGWADFDHDGDLDLLVGGRDTGGGRPNFLFRNEIGSQNRWLALRLVGDGVKVNRDAIGARVSLVFSDRTLTREVHSSRGMHASADTRALHFGLGDLGCDYVLEVRWPDGTTATFLPAEFQEEQWLTLTYPDQLQ